MRSMFAEAACCANMWGYLTTLRVTSVVYIRATLRRFDSKHATGPKMGPLIPCERRLSKTEIWEIQEVTFGARFEIRDYDRPFSDISVTLCRFD